MLGKEERQTQLGVVELIEMNLGLVSLATGGPGSLLSATLSVGVIFLILAMVVRRTRFLYALRKVPYPYALPFIGNAFQLNCTLEEFFKKLILWSRKFGDMYLVWVGPRPFVFVYRVEAVQPLLTSNVHIDKSLEYDYLKPWLGSGLVTSSGNKWHSRRKLLTPTFHSEILKDYCKIASKEASTLVECLRQEIGNCDFDFVPYAKRAALDVICQSSMGYHVNAQKDYNNDYVVAVRKLAIITQQRFTKIWMSFDPIFKRSSLGKEYENSLNVIKKFVDKVITDRKSAWKSMEKSQIEEVSKKGKALLDLMLEMLEEGEKLTDKDLRDEVNTFMFAGHDTLAMSTSWLLYALGRHPEFQKKILDEYYENCLEDDESLESVKKLVWLEACIKETLRLYPAVPLIARQIYSPIQIMETEIPVGSTVLINSYLLHRDPRYFPQPELFKPERFLPNSSKIPAYAFIPFSAGCRNCIGYKFAMLEIKITALKILKAYEIHSIDKEDQLRFTSEILLNNVAGMRLKITPRL